MRSSRAGPTIGALVVVALVLPASCDAQEPLVDVPRVVGEGPLEAKEQLERAGFEVEFSRPPEHCPARWEQCRLPLEKATDLIVVAQQGTARSGPNRREGGARRPRGSRITLTLTTEPVTSCGHHTERVSLAPARGPFGTRVRIRADCYYQRNLSMRQASYFNLMRLVGDCELLVGLEGRFRIEDHRVRGWFRLADRRGTCFQDPGSGRVEVRPGRYRLVLGCHACNPAIFKLTHR
ncbi:MAG: hypothetical protein ACRDKZ_13735 [Actinomycetota bacterium]